MTIFYLVLMIDMTLPHKGQLMLPSQVTYQTLVLCKEELDKLEPKIDSLIKSIMGSKVTYEKANLSCVERPAPGEPI
jgi:hypothetical protein